MRIISLSRLSEFWENYTLAERPLRAWYNHVEQAQWHNFAEVRNDFA
jgi:mRNA interferase HigB